MKFFQKIMTILIVVVATFVLSLSSASAQVSGVGGMGQETPFGGLMVFSLMCTCSDDGSSINFLDDYKTSQVLKLLYKPGQSKIFSNNEITMMMTYELGTYSQGDTCSIRAGQYCIDIQADGNYGKQPGTGTSYNSNIKNLFAKSTEFSPKMYQAFVEPLKSFLRNI